MFATFRPHSNQTPSGPIAEIDISFGGQIYIRKLSIASSLLNKRFWNSLSFAYFKIKISQILPFNCVKTCKYSLLSCNIIM